MRILDGELQRRAQLMRIERAMARLVLPARILLDESLVADRAPVADARRIAGKAWRRSRQNDRARIDRHIRIAFAGAEAVAHADDEEIGDLHLHLGNRRPPISTVTQAPGDRGSRVAPACRRAASRPCRARPAARRGQPGAVDGLRVLEPVHAGQDGVAGVQVVGAVAADVRLRSDPSRSWRTWSRSSRRRGARPAGARRPAPGSCARHRSGSPRSPDAPRVSAGSRKKRKGFSTCQTMRGSPRAPARA